MDRLHHYRGVRVRIDFIFDATSFTRKQQRLAKRLIRRLPTGPNIDPGNVYDESGNLIGWAINHDSLDEVDQLRLQYALTQLADDDPAFTNPDLNNDGKITADDVRALRDRIDADPDVAAAIRSYRQSIKP